MHFNLVSDAALSTPADALILPVFKYDARSKPKALVRVDEQLGGQLLSIASHEKFQGETEQTLVLHTHGKLSVSKLILLGLGTQAKFTPEVLRMAAGRGAHILGKTQSKKVAFQQPEPTQALPETLRATVEGLELGAYQYSRWQTQKKDFETPRIDKVQLLLPEGVQKTKQLADAVQLGQQVAAATNWARDLVNEPASTMTPTHLTQEAKKMAQKVGLNISIGNKSKIQALRMGMFLGVAKGSVEEPRLVQLSWIPKDARAAKAAPVCIVGKAITFDSGGLSLKPSDAMVDMKTDMAGSAAMLGAMRVVAWLKPPFPVHGFFGACENMPSGTAYRLGDVLVSRLGKTVEITNTDAEGRLVLGDVLAWANEQKPAILIDLATLTGACIIALGNHITGVFGDDERAVKDVLEAGQHAGELLWRLPVSELQKEALKSDIADMKNAGDRPGGAINAALFLQEFVGTTPWVHFDIAGPSHVSKDRGYFRKGATGVGVRTLVEFIRRRAAS